MGVQFREWANWARSRKFAAMVLVMVTLAIGTVIGTLVSGRVGATRAMLANGATPLDLPNPVSMSNAFAAIVSHDQPAVVNISTTQVIERRDESPHGAAAARIPFRISSTASSIPPRKSLRPNAAWAPA